jgi:hypothetical protein
MNFFYNETTRRVSHLPPTLPPSLAFLNPRVLELTYTAWDLAGFARDLGL